ncbi:hypothetical protein TL16_g00651 [Triparma laevis f. inornata]|uniref:Uncharacterized protein n=1 Tax=Triparma laevis f. inornata TaxID=1714386 RepID=A0A9W6Z8F2_9STRA|nr:hypothetical protein TL16_g00651 [Triparma laevis f. inornata]
MPLWSSGVNTELGFMYVGGVLIMVSLLGIYLIFVITLLILMIRLGVEGSQTLDSIEWTLANKDSIGSTLTHIPYDKLEKIITPKFNTNYFNDLCTEFPKSGWFFKYVDEHCPTSMTYGSCSLGNNWETCNTDASGRGSCPKENACDNAMENNAYKDESYSDTALQNCAYHECRYGTLKYVHDEMGPVQDIIKFVVYVLLAMIFLTGLLICYNPQDDVSQQLVKTGVMVETRKVKKPEPRGLGPGGVDRRKSTGNHGSGGRQRMSNSGNRV